MKYYFIMFCFLYFYLFTGCNKKSIALNSEKLECEKFESFINKEWKYDNSSSTYYFEGNPEYWYDTRYFNPSCLVGKKKEEVLSVYGKPSKTFTFIDFEYFTYCIDESCLRSMKSEGKQIVFFVDSLNVINQVIISPPMQKRRINY